MAKKIYVVRRPFKSNGKFYAVGDIISPASPIKRLNSKIQDRKIICLMENEEFPGMVSYLENRAGKELSTKYKALLSTKQTVVAKSEEKKQPTAPTTEAKVSTSRSTTAAKKAVEGTGKKTAAAKAGKSTEK